MLENFLVYILEHLRYFNNLGHLVWQKYVNINSCVISLGKLDLIDYHFQLYGPKWNLIFDRDPLRIQPTDIKFWGVDVCTLVSWVVCRVGNVEESILELTVWSTDNLNRQIMNRVGKVQPVLDYTQFPYAFLASWYYECS